MDILYILKERFEELRSLMLKVSDGPQGEMARSLQGQLAQKIRILSRIQSDYIYPEIRGSNSTLDGIIGQSGQYLERIELFLEGGPPYEAGKLPSFLESVREYITHEETHLMPKLRITMRTEDREDLGQVVVDAEEELQKLAPDDARSMASPSSALARSRGGRAGKSERAANRVP